MLVFRYASNQRTMRRIKKRIQANILAVRLFPDQLGVVLHAYFQVLCYTFVYLGYALRALAILLLPMLIVLAQLNLRFSRLPLQPGDSFILQAKLMRSLRIESASLRLPRGMKVTAPPVHIPALNEVDWQIQANENGDFWPAVVIAGQTFTKRVVVSNDIASLHAKREQKSLLNWISNPGGRALPPAGPLRSIGIDYAPRTIQVGPLHTEWWVFFFAFAFASGFAAKVCLRVEL